MKNKLLVSLIVIMGLFAAVGIPAYADVIFVPSVSDWNPLVLILLLVAAAILIAAVVLWIIRRKK